MTDAAAMSIIAQDQKLAVAYLTDFSCNTGNQLVATWRDFYAYLFPRYMDGNIKTALPGQKNPKVENPPLPDWYLRTIINHMGDKQKVVE